MHVRGNQITDTIGTNLLLRGAEIPGLNVANPGDDAQQNVQAMNPMTFGTIRQIWNMNAVRLPVSSWIWEQNGQSYLEMVGGVVSQGKCRRAGGGSRPSLRTRAAERPRAADFPARR